MRRWMVLGLLLLIALGLRLVNLGGRTLWYDEAFAVLFAEQGLDAMRAGTLEQADGSAADVHPLLYYVTLHGWMRIAGQSAAAVRLYSALVGALSVAVVYGLARDWFGERTGRAAGLIAAIAPFHVQYSQEARMYALLGLALLLTTWLYWRAWQGQGPAWWIAFGVLAGISMYVQQLAALYLLALGLLPVLFRDGPRLVRTVGGAGVAFAVYLPWMVNLPEQMGKLRQYWVERPNVLHLWLALRSFVSVNLDFSPAWWLPTFLLAAVLVVLLFYRAWAARQSLPPGDHERAALGWALWLTLAPMLLMWVASYVLQPVFLPRALLPSALIFYVAMGWLFTRGGMPRPVVAIVAGAWAVVAAFGLVTHYSWDTFPNPPFDRAVRYLEEAVTEGDAIVHGNKITALPMVYYGRDLPQRYVRDIPGSGSDTLALPTQRALGLLADECVAEAAGGAERVWYVAFDRLEDEMAALVADDVQNEQYDSLGWLRRRYTEQDTVRFSDLVIALFSGPDAQAREAMCP
ncbi:MAG: glycosyltransferase family 39 protein [Anaerolineae bacterium]|nr:glycosyltransferase family 39 protein [Anaerolineae bacterium]